MVEKVEVVRVGKARRAKLFYLRDRLGKSAKTKEKIGARIIARNSGNWFHAFTIDKGLNDGLAIDMNVIAGGGLVGRIEEIGANWAKVNSIINDNSNVANKNIGILNAEGHKEENILVNRGMITDKLKELFPQARVLRMDADTTKSKDSYEKILSQFANEEADILVGTQMIVKGHDFPKVTLVGVIAADMSLHVGDYRAAERTFQLLTQAVGRAGRGSIPGNAVIQTYQPENYAVNAAAAQDYEAFYEMEIAYRDLMSYPPMSGMLAMLLQSADEELLETEDEKIKLHILEMEIPLLRVTGPTAAVISKLNDIYRRVIYLKHEDTKELYRVREMIEKSVKNEEIHKEIRVEFDENPLYAY